MHSEASVGIIGPRNILTDEKIAKRYGCTLSYIRKDVSRLHVNLFATRNRISRVVRARIHASRDPRRVTCFITHFGFVKRNDEGSNVSERVKRIKRKKKRRIVFRTIPSTYKVSTCNQFDEA